MKRRLSSQESERQWNVLLNQIPQKKNNNIYIDTTNTNIDNKEVFVVDNKSSSRRRRRIKHQQQQQQHQHQQEQKDDDENEDEEEKDPFDCSDIIVPTTHSMIDNVVDDAVLDWNELDYRKIKVPTTTSNINANNNKRRRRYGGKINLKLPSNFDIYATTTTTEVPLSTNNNNNSENEDENEDDDDDEDRIISLDDPTIQLSYTKELYNKVFTTVPTAEEIENHIRRSSSNKYMTNVLEMYKKIAVHHETKETTTTKISSSSIDCHHVLSRLRRSDRHGLPPILPSQSPPPPPPRTTATTTPTSNHNNTSTSSTLIYSTIRFEFWKNRQLKRGPSPDSNRMVLEFLSTQSLYDVHMSIIQLLEDDFWEEKCCMDNNSNNEYNNHDGCFFIENVFYIPPSEGSNGVGGNNKYVEPILQWIDGRRRLQREEEEGRGNEGTGQIQQQQQQQQQTNNPIRRGYLGLPMKDSMTKSMKDTKLSDIPMRLGVRYYHVCHGDVETSVFLTDKKVITTPPTTSTSTKSTATRNTNKYPIIHDIWTSNYPIPYCDACKHWVAQYVTSIECDITDGGPKQLCKRCCDQLGLILPTVDDIGDNNDDTNYDGGNNNNNNNHGYNNKLVVMPYKIWRREADLSTSADNKNTSKFF